MQQNRSGISGSKCIKILILLLWPNWSPEGYVIYTFKISVAEYLFFMISSAWYMKMIHVIKMDKKHTSL